MSDGREEREEQEKRREWEREKRRPDDDRIPDDDDWVPERYDSKAVETPTATDTAAPADAAVLLDRPQRTDRAVAEAAAQGLPEGRGGGAGGLRGARYVWAATGLQPECAHASAEPAGDRDVGCAATGTYADQIRLQTDQAYRADRLHRPAS